MISNTQSKKWHDELRKEIFANPQARAEYESFKLQLELAERMKNARKKVHLIR